ncbi:cupin domain-containing protein [Streptomyces sp. NPDC006333]|uniref:JmjC domain-containing protein n=1 Tax=Streptomyces sp. NPDC006333 TaxID=3156753 RepID=UPI0033A0232A
MEHILEQSLQQSLGWNDSGSSRRFAHGHTGLAPALLERLASPYGLIDLARSRNFGKSLRCRNAQGAVGSSRFTSEGRLDPRKLRKIANNGCTLIYDGLNLYTPELEVACRALSWQAGEDVWANAYLSIGDTPGFPLHRDSHDTLIVQVSGQKNWEVRRRSIGSAAEAADVESGGESAPSEILWSGQLQAGDALYIPEGYWHVATRSGLGGDSHSLHLTFGIERCTGARWAQWVAAAVAEDDMFRRQIDNAGSAVDELSERLAEIGRTKSFPAMQVSRQETATSKYQAVHIPSFGSLERAVAITPFAPSIQVDRAGVRVRAANVEIELRSEAESLIRLLLSGHPVDLGSDPSVRRLAITLIEHGLLAPLTSYSAAGYDGFVRTLFMTSPRHSAVGM